MNARERGMSTKTDRNKQGWQKSQFPVACQKCYGQNPYMRMLKQNYGQQCRLCFRPFTVFKWKGDRGIYKRTILCNSCSKDKNLCQVCTLDLQFGLPMEIRDKRCGVNGKYLTNENFVNEQSKRVKPPPPNMPPPVPKNKYEQKQAVFIPDKQESEDQQVEEKKEKVENHDEENEQKQQKNENQQNEDIVENGENEKADNDEKEENAAEIDKLQQQEKIEELKK